MYVLGASGSDARLDLIGVLAREPDGFLYFSCSVDGAVSLGRMRECFAYLAMGG